jgi:hypothetical protein
MLNHPLLVVELPQVLMQLLVPPQLVLVQLLEPPQLVLAYVTHLWAL